MGSLSKHQSIHHGEDFSSFSCFYSQLLHIFVFDQKKKKKSGDSVDRSPKDTLKYRMKEKVLSWVIGTVPAGCIIDF